MPMIMLLVVCHCGHRNRPTNGYRKSIQMILRGELAPCRSCGARLNPEFPNTLTGRRIYQELIDTGEFPVLHPKL
ncbi:MAG: hypothetical protein O2794_02920 [bacterium]|nr:hypothetical protein [bacterium]